MATIHTLMPNTIEMCLHALANIPDKELVFTGAAKTTFAETMAEALRHPPAFEYYNKAPVLRGYLMASFNEDDSGYAGMAAGRVWFRCNE